MRAIHELRAEEGGDLSGIALYTEPDRLARFVREADEAISLGPALRRAADGRMKPAYLDQERVLAALRAVRADAVWPGWGFLAEDPNFVERLEAAGLAFLGPRAETMRALGDKMRSKQLAESAGVPVARWSGGPVERDSVAEVARDIGFPCMLKATSGGGGRGIRLIRSVDDLAAAFDSATNEASSAFGDGTLFIESFIGAARHVEVQTVADQHGSVLALGLRDCSVQRRHQKVIEEGPPPGLPSELKREMREASIALMRKVGYVGVATCEYLVTENERFFFLEVNPRLQVEHGVTEVLTAFDLVKSQIRIARGEALPSKTPAERGCAIEARLCAEDPASAFIPSPGRIALLDLPIGPGIRVDEGISLGETIPSEFDSMIAKIIASGGSRGEARARLVRALDDTRVVVENGTTNKGFLLDILSHPEFEAARCDTGWLDRTPLASAPESSIEALLVAAILSYQHERGADRLNFYAEASRGRPRRVPASAGSEIDLVYAGVPYRLKVFAIGSWTYRVYLGSRVAQVSLLEQGAHARQLLMGEARHSVLFSESDVEYRIELDGRVHSILRDVGGKVRAPAPALLIEMAVATGDAVAVGDRLGLLEAMKTETAFFAPVSGTVREVVARAGEHVAAGDVLLVIEPSSDVAPGEPQRSEPLELPDVADPLDALVDPASGHVDLSLASDLPATRSAAVLALRSETRRILMGYDVNPERANRLVEILEAPVDRISDAFRAELAQLSRAVEIFLDIETLFVRTPSREGPDKLGPSNDERMAMYLRRMGAKGAGIHPEFLERLGRTLTHYDIHSLEPTDGLQRAGLRIHATRTTLELRRRLVTALLHLLVRLGEQGERFSRHPELPDVLDGLALLRGTIPATIADLAAQARYLIFERDSATAEGVSSPAADPEHTIVEPPDPDALAARAGELGITPEEARRIELWRLENFDLERIDTFPGIYAFYGRARSQAGDERIFCFTEVTDLGPGVPRSPDLGAFEQRFHEAIEAMRSIQAVRDPTHRLQWNRLYLLIRPPIVLTPGLRDQALRRLAPETGNLGLEKVIVRLALVDPSEGARPTRMLEVLSGNPTGSRVETTFRAPHTSPLETATPYERRTAWAKARGHTHPYEIVRLFTGAPAQEATRPGDPVNAGAFEEFDLVDGRPEPIERPWGENECGVVFGRITTPTLKVPEGMSRMLILGDPTRGMGALADPECARIVAAIDVAEREGIPVDWVGLSSGARIAMESGTENLDATARVVRRLVTFTDGGGEVNMILPGVNVGAQSYFDALATMGLHTRGILIMLPASSMVLTGRAALEVSGGVAAEDEIGIGGYERIMGPTGEAQFQARDLNDAYQILLQYYGTSYCVPGEPGPRPFRTGDPNDRDVTQSAYDGEDGFSTIGEIFSDELNPGRKRPFAMRPLMRSVIDGDAGWLERWRDWRRAETAIVWDSHLGGRPITLIGIESQPIARVGYVPNDGPDNWTAGTLFPQSSKKVARAINASSGNRPVVILANLSGFDGSPESMRSGILEYGAEIARAVVRFRGKLIFTVVSRYHGGAYVVFSRELNDEMHPVALSGSYASVIGGSAAAAVVFPREVRGRANRDPRVTEALSRLEAASGATHRATLRARFEQVLQEVILEKQAEVAAEFDGIHTVGRAMEVGSLEAILAPEKLRPALVDWLERE